MFPRNALTNYSDSSTLSDWPEESHAPYLLSKTNQLSSFLIHLPKVNAVSPEFCPFFKKSKERTVSSTLGANQQWSELLYWRRRQSSKSVEPHDIHHSSSVQSLRRWQMSCSLVDLNDTTPYISSVD